MRLFKKTIILLLILSPSFTLVNCGGEKESTTKETKTPDQFDEVKNLIDAVKSEKIVFNNSNPTDVAKNIIGDEFDGMVKGEKYFEKDSSLQLKTTVNFTNNKLYELFYDFFFVDKDKAQSQITKDAEELKKILDKEYGNTIDEYDMDEMQTYTWAGDGYEIRLEIFDDGYTIALKGNNEVVAGEPSAEISEIVNLCTPLLENINNGSIKVGVSTESNLENILNFSDKRLDVDLNGIRLGGSYTLNGDNTLNSIFFDFFFTDAKDLPRSLADADVIFSKAKDIFGEPTTSNLFETGSMDIWDLDQANLNLNSFDDGYSLTYETKKEL